MKVINYLKASLLTLLITSIFVVTGCKQRTSTSQAGESATDSSALNMQEVKSDVQDIVYPLPAPFELSQQLDRAGASYVGNVLNPVSNADKYFTEKSKALALGVYGADLAYAGTYNNAKDINKYSGVLKSLVDDLGINVKYTDYFNDDSREKLNNKDTLVKVVSNVFYDTYTFLNKKSDPALAALVVSGTWVEGLYIATHITKDTYNNNEMVKLIYDQSKSLEKVISLLDKFENNEMVAGISGALKKLKAMYDETNGSLTKEQLDTITKTIETIRSSIVS